MKELAEGLQSNTKWALKTYQEWCMTRNNQSELESVPYDLLLSEDPEKLIPVVEARKNQERSTPLPHSIKFSEDLIYAT